MGYSPWGGRELAPRGVWCRQQQSYFGLQIPLGISSLSTEGCIHECGYIHYIEFKEESSGPPEAHVKPFWGS